MDYIKKLPDAELKYLNQFMAEYVSGAFKKDEAGDYSKENLHKTVEERRKCYTRNNTRNRCGLTISNATGQTIRCDDMNEFIDSLNSDNYVANANAFSDRVMDEYDGSYDNVEDEILNEMLADYERCINPKSNADLVLAESNYGKKLLLEFNNSDLIKKRS